MKVAYVITYISGVNYLSHFHLHLVLNVKSKCSYVSTPPYALKVRTAINLTVSVSGVNMMSY